jgi:hypothetical protein
MPPTNPKAQIAPTILDDPVKAADLKTSFRILSLARDEAFIGVVDKDFLHQGVELAWGD